MALNLRHKVERAWYSSRPFYWLLPLQPLYLLIGVLRRLAYRLGLLASWRAPLPVLVVGNISIGGTGKTPLSISLIETAQALGLRVGLVSRGYGRNNKNTIIVEASDSAARVGDEPLLIKLRTAAAVAVAPKRALAVKALLAEQDLDLIIADDGLQHYALARDFELLVLDSQRGLGNGWQLPCGPLREPATRMQSVDAIVVNQRHSESAGQAFAMPNKLCSSMVLQGLGLRNLVTGEQKDLADFSGAEVKAIAGIGNPEPFFEDLRQAGLIVQALDFADHHRFSAKDLPKSEQVVIMTEKDAVKLAAFAKQLEHPNCWYLPVAAKLESGFAEQVIRQTLATRLNTDSASAK